MAIAEHPILCLLRHGTTPWNRENRFLGSSDVGLDGDGRREVSSAVREIAGFAPVRVLVSPARRARETVHELERLEVLDAATVDVVEDLRELGFGRFEGRTRSELSTGEDAASFDRWLRPQHGFPPAPNGETWQDAAERAGRVLDRVRESGERTLVVSHGYLLKIALAEYVDGEAVDDVRNTHLPNAVPVFLAPASAGRWRRTAPVRHPEGAAAARRMPG